MKRTLKNDRVAFAVSSDEKDKYQAFANNAGLSLSIMARMAIEEYMRRHQK